MMRISRRFPRVLAGISAGVVFLVVLPCAGAQVPVPLQNATADFSQTFAGDYSIARAINGTTADDRGWAVNPQEGSSHVGVFETVSNVGDPSGSVLTFTLTQTHSNPGHTLGRFRLSLTTDDRSLFADGLQSGGDVTANWIILDPVSVTTLNGTTLTEQGDLSLLASGPNPGTDVYTITAITNLTGITGFRLEAIADPSLPSNGPGRFPSNGNFVLSEFEVGISAATAAPEPATLALLAAGLLPAAGVALRRRKTH